MLQKRFQDPEQTNASADICKLQAGNWRCLHSTEDKEMRFTIEITKLLSVHCYDGGLENAPHHSLEPK